MFTLLKNLIQLDIRKTKAKCYESARNFKKNDQKSCFNFPKNRRLQACIEAFATTSKRDYGKVQCQNIGLMRVLSIKNLANPYSIFKYNFQKRENYAIC